MEMRLEEAEAPIAYCPPPKVIGQNLQPPLPPPSGSPSLLPPAPPSICRLLSCPLTSLPVIDNPSHGPPAFFLSPRSLHRLPSMGLSQTLSKQVVTVLERLQRLLLRAHQKAQTRWLVLFLLRAGASQLSPYTCTRPHPPPHRPVHLLHAHSRWRVQPAQSPPLLVGSQLREVCSESSHSAKGLLPPCAPGPSASCGLSVPLCCLRALDVLQLPNQSWSQGVIAMWCDSSRNPLEFKNT